MSEEEKRRSGGVAPEGEANGAEEVTSAGKPVDWDHEVPAWETSFPADETTPSGNSEGPPPDNEQLVLDEVEGEDSLPLPYLPPDGEDGNDAGAVPVDTGLDLADEEGVEDTRIDHDLSHMTADAEEARRREQAPTPPSGILYDEEREPTLKTPAPGITPAALTRVEDDSSSVLIIPDVAALEAAAGAPASWQRTPPPLVTELPEAVATSTAASPTPRDLTADGLPDLSELFADPTPTLPLPGEPDWDASPSESTGSADPFSEPLPAETAEDLELKLELPSRSWIWSPEALAAEVAAEGEGRPHHPDQSYWRAQLAVALDELAAVRARGATGPEVAWRAFAAARIAERAGKDEEPTAHRLLAEAREAEPAFLPPVRAELRRAARTGARDELAQRLATLADAVAEDADAYRTLLAESQARAEGTSQSEGAPADLTAALRGAERALLTEGTQSEQRRAAGEALAALSDKLAGEAAAALRAVASLCFERTGEVQRAAELRSGAGQETAVLSTLAELRAAARGGQPGSWDAVAAGMQSWAPGAPMATAVARWAARSGDRHAPAAADEASLEFISALLPEAVDRALASDTAADAAGPVAPEGLTEELAPLVLRRLVAGKTAAEQADLRQAASLVLEVAGSDPGPLVGVLLQTLVPAAAADGSPAALAEARQALGRWAQLDPARRAAAERSAAWRSLRVPATELEAAELAVESAGSVAPGEASFWLLSWHLRKARQAEAASRLLGRGAQRWETRPAPAGLAATLQARAAELDAAASPQRLLDRLPVPSFAVETPDDPRELVRQLLGEVNDPRPVAERWKEAATAGSVFRWVETAGWLREAGAHGEALGLLLDAASRSEDLPHMSLLQRRLVRLVGDAPTQATVLGDWLAAVEDPADRAELEMLRAEALERSGAEREASGIYRELLASPLMRDADLALRRTLWSLRDAAALEELWRDEHDAQSGAGRVRAASAALVEKARVVRDLRGDEAAAAEELRAALDEDSTQKDARVMLLTSAGGGIVSGSGLAQLGELGRQLSPHTPSLLFLVSLLAQKQGEIELAERLLRESLDQAGRALPLGVLRRLVISEEVRVAAGGEAAPAAAVMETGAAHAADAATAPVAGGARGDLRLATALYLRAAELREQAARADAAWVAAGASPFELVDRALALEPDHLTVLLRKARQVIAGGGDEQTMNALAALARALRGPRRAATMLAAAAVASGRLHDQARARALLEEALSLDPADASAFAWLRQLLETDGDHAGLAGLLARRTAVTSGPEAAGLRVARADLLAGPLADSAGARAELAAVLETDPQHVGALARLAALEQQEGNHGASAALSIRQARFERDPQALMDCFLRIGRLHTGPLEDPKLALGAYERVLRIQPLHREALEALSELYAREADTRKALAVTERLMELETESARRLPYLMKMGTLWEAAGDPRRAGVVYRRAVDELPRDLTALGELARFHERQGDLSARNLLLDGSLALVRQDLRRSPADLPTLRILIPLLRWRQRTAAASMATQLLARFTDDEMERAEAASFLGSGRASGGSVRRLAALANPELDERAMPADLQTGVRHVLRLLGPNLARLHKPDLRAHHVGRAQRQGRGTTVREELAPIAADLGVRELEVYVSTESPRAMVVEPGNPPAIILGSELVSLGPAALRFAAASCLRLVETHFDLLTQGGAAEAGSLVAAIVRQFIPEFGHPRLDGQTLAAAEARVSRAMARNLRTELGPFASQIAGAFSPEALYLDAMETGARAGLLACGDLPAALEVLARAAGHPTATPANILELPLCNRLCVFALSDDYEELAQALGTVS